MQLRRAEAVENADGPPDQETDEARTFLGPRLTVALEHAHLLVFRPRDAKGGELGRLVAAGWSANGIVTLSQLVSSLAFQITAAAER